MTITRKQIDSTLVIALEGYLDTRTAPILHEELDKGLDGINELFWDFSKLEYMTSAGFRELLRAQDMLGDSGRMKVIHAREEVQKAFYLTGLDDLLG